MIDFLKCSSEDQNHITRLYTFANANLKPQRPQNNNYLCFGNGSNRFRLEFRKVYEKGQNIGFRNVEVCFSAHYVFNSDLHNGNDCSPIQAIKTIKETFLRIGITANELQDFKVVNLEYGLNLNTGLLIENLIDGILYTNRTAFKIPDKKYQYSKLSDTSKFKQLKAYAKGLQFLDRPEYGIDRNTFRFEVRAKKHSKIKTLGIYTISDLLKLDNYSALFQSIVDEWQNVLIINSEVKNHYNTPKFWTAILAHKDRNKFRDERLKFYENLDQKINLHRLIKLKIIDKITALTKYAYCPQRTPINKGKTILDKSSQYLLKGQIAYSLNNNEEIIRLCKITNIDISRQRKGSKFIRENTLKALRENDPETYQKLEKKYLTEKMRSQPLEKQFYYIAKVIRDQDSNPRNNRKSFEQRNYKKDQLEFNF